MDGQRKLSDLFFSHAGMISDKWEQYLSIYGAELQHLAGTDAHLLEVGVQNGGSMAIWADYFGPDARLVGLDIDPRILELETPPHVELYVADATDPAAVDLALGDSTFDVIVDDGSHRSPDINATFVELFSRLRPGGKYFIEDLHCSYWEEYGGGLRRPDAAIERLKRIVDLLNADHFEADDDPVLDGIEPDLRQNVARITFYDSVAVVERLREPKTRPYRRILTGEDGHLVTPIQLLSVEDPGQLLFTEPLARSIETTLLDSIAELESSNSQAQEAVRFLKDEQRELQAELARRTEVERELIARAQARQERNAAIYAVRDELQRAADRDRQVPRIEFLVDQVRSTQERLVAEQLATAAAHAEVDQLQLAVEQFQDAMRHKQNEIDALRRSRSYRMMDPLRHVAGSLRTLRPGHAAGDPPGDADEVRPGKRRTTADRLLDDERAELYAEWVRRYDELSAADRESIAVAADELSGPDVLVLLDVANASTTALTDAVRSLRGQFYKRWRAVIVASDDTYGSDVTRTARKLAAIEPRITVVSSAEADDAVLAAEAVLVSGADVTLRPHALYLLVEALGADDVLVYGDDDLIDCHGRRVRPNFKPSFSPEFQRNGGYIGSTFLLHRPPEAVLGAVRRSIVGRSAAAVDWSAVLSDLPRDRVQHVPFITHHRLHDATQPPIRTTTPRSTDTDDAPLVQVIIPTRNRVELLRPCIDSILDVTNYPRDRFEIVVVDNGSDQDETLSYLEYLQRAGDARVITDDGVFNFARLNNSAASGSHADVFVLLNNDTVITEPEWMALLARYATIEDVGVVGGQLLYPDGSSQHDGVVIGIQGVAGHVNHMVDLESPAYHSVGGVTREVAAVTGACLAVRRSVFEEVGGMDERLAVAFNDTDLCLAALDRGYRNIYIGRPLLTHFESKSRGYDDSPVRVKAFRREAEYARSKHRTTFAEDPYYSPNLSRNSAYDLAFPPRAVRPWRLAKRRKGGPLTILILSATHQVGHGVPVVINIQAAYLASLGHRVILGGPASDNDFDYVGCERAILPDHGAAADLAVREGVDLVLMQTPPFFGTSRWLGPEQVKMAYDYGEPDPSFFPDFEEREAVLAEKRFCLQMADARFAISDAVRDEAAFEDMGVIPLANSHLAVWADSMIGRRADLRERRGWTDKVVVLNVCRFHGAERQYKGVDTYCALMEIVRRCEPGLASRLVFVLCGKADAEDVRQMESVGLSVFANVSDDELIDLYVAADCYANFSRWEGYNLGIGQALAMGLPTIASDIPAHRAFGIPTSDNPVAQFEFIEHIAANGADQVERTPRVWQWYDHVKLLDQIIRRLVDQPRA